MTQLLYDWAHGIGHGVLIASVVEAFDLSALYGPCAQLAMWKWPPSDRILAKIATCDDAPSLELAVTCADGGLQLSGRIQVSLLAYPKLTFSRDVQDSFTPTLTSVTPETQTMPTLPYELLLALQTLDLCIHQSS